MSHPSTFSEGPVTASHKGKTPLSHGVSLQPPPPIVTQHNSTACAELLSCVTLGICLTTLCIHL